MNIALVLQDKMLLGLQRFVQGRTQPAQPAVTQTRYTGMAGVAVRRSAPKTIPLRVLRVVESDMPRSSVGRLVISGRMVDVCAELDRLVACEAALH